MSLLSMLPAVARRGTRPPVKPLWSAAAASYNRAWRQQHTDCGADKQVSREVTVGFIGLGQMGFPMAANLRHNSRCRMVVFDASPAAMEKFATSRSPRLAADAVDEPIPEVHVAGSPAELAERCDVVISMLPASKHVLNVYEGPKGVLEGLKSGSLVVDCSTIDPDVAEHVVKKIKRSGSVGLDAPVSGGTVGAEAGTLTFMVGAETEADYLRAKPWLRRMGKNLVHCGGPGKGQAAKICNNMLLGITMIGTCETMSLGVKMGLDPAVLSNIINTSSGRCWSSEVNNPYPGIVPTAPASRDYEGGFGVSLMAKDMGLATAAAHKNNATIFLGAAAHQIYGHVARQPDFQRKDFSSVYKWIASVAADPCPGSSSKS